MICTRCLSSLRPKPLCSYSRAISTSSRLLNPTTAPAFTTPAIKLETATPKSSHPAGVALKGLNYLKGREDPIAKEESEYPEWLWTILDERVEEKSTSGSGDGDEFSKSKKVRRMVAKAQRKLEARLAASGDLESLKPKVPLTQQTIDLPRNEDGTLDGAAEARGARAELKSAMRRERRAGIKSKNFLKSM